MVEVLVASGVSGVVPDPAGGPWTRVAGVDMSGYLMVRLGLLYSSVSNWADTRHQLRSQDVNPHSAPSAGDVLYTSGVCGMDSQVDVSYGPFIVDPTTHHVYLFAAACSGGNEEFAWSIFGDDSLYYFDYVLGRYSTLPVISGGVGGTALSGWHDPMLDLILASVRKTYG